MKQMNEQDKTPTVGTRPVELNPLRTLAESQRIQQLQALATYGRVVLTAGEVKPAKVAPLTPAEVADVAEAFTAPLF